MDNNLNQKKSDSLLKLALEEQLEIDQEMELYNEPEPHAFSEEHNKKMKEMEKMALRYENKGRNRRKYAQAAAAILVFCCLSGFTIMKVDAFRIPLMNFFTEIKNEYTFLGVQKGNNFEVTENHREYEPQYVPVGFSVSKVEETDHAFSIEYYNESNGQAYCFYFLDKIASRAVDTEDSTVKEGLINGNKVTIIEKMDEIRMFLEKDGHQFYIQGNISQDEAYKILESLK